MANNNMIEERKLFCMKPEGKHEKSFYVSIKDDSSKAKFCFIQKELILYHSDNYFQCYVKEDFEDQVKKHTNIE